jgi:hypothetical protein
MGRNITILGMGPSANERRHDIARYVEGREVWGMNDGFRKFSGFTGWARWYEVHGLDYLMGWCADRGKLGYFREMDALGVPVYRSEPLPCIAKQEPFPELAMGLHFGCNFWDGTPTRMLAHAVYEHDAGQAIDSIQSWGIDMLDDQHAAQLPVWTFWCAMVHARGIKLEGTALARTAGAESDAGTAHLRALIGAQMEQHAATRLGG